jgi:DNA modification methylase
MLDTLASVQTANTSLEARFADKLEVNRQLNRQLVSFQANKDKPAYRWFKYREGFSEALIQHVLDYLGLEQGNVLDPFAGSGTALFVAAERGLHAQGIELLPVGCEVAEVRELVRCGDAAAMAATIEHWAAHRPWKDLAAGRPFPHLRITSGAFPDESEQALGRYLAALQAEPEPIARLLRFAALCILEEISYTRKDGQYLRWDYRSGRKQGDKPFSKGPIYTFEQAITGKLAQIADDLRRVNMETQYSLFDAPKSRQTGTLEIQGGSCLDILPTLRTGSFDGLITSPPYANRYDYTRTYALELALLGVDETEIRALRQAMVSCTVENREKNTLASTFSSSVYQQAISAFEGQAELKTILTYLNWQKSSKALNNPGIPRMVRNYFFELALIIFDCARLLKPGAPFVMVNDNVRYSGATIPVDLILSDFAEKAGCEVEVIWVLPVGKGNSSQQMGAHGREALRKCIYVWRRKA